MDSHGRGKTEDDGRNVRKGGALMKRVAAAGLALLTLLLFPALAAASHGGGPGGPQDFAVGGGTTGAREDPSGVQHIDFAAKGGPTTLDPLTGFGGPVTGHFRAGGAFDQAGITAFQQEGPITCLVVDGNQARLVYPVKEASAQTSEGTVLLENSEVLFFLEDNGRPENGRPVDRVGFELLADESPADDPPSEQDTECVAPTPPPTFQLTKGNLTVHEGQ
jgi:hypothetical protein